MKYTDTFKIPIRSGSGASSTGSRYGSSKSSGYGTGSSSAYGTSYTSGYGGTSAGSSYDSGYSRTPSYGTGLSSNYGGSTYSSSYGSSYSGSAGAGSGSYGAGTGYAGSSYGRSPRESGSNAAGVGGVGGGNANYTASAYTSRASRDRSAERSLDSIYTPRNSRRSSGSTSDLYSRSGIRKSSSYSGLLWTQTQEEKKHRVVNVNDMIYKSHRRQGSNSSNNSDTAVFEESKPGISRSRESSQRGKPPKRDLEAILGKEDHLLVQRIIEENKELIEETHAKLTSQEEKLIQKIMEASSSGSSLDCLDILTIIESH